jgi:hypothetical protein
MCDLGDKPVQAGRNWLALGSLDAAIDDESGLDRAAADVDGEERPIAQA